MTSYLLGRHPGRASAVDGNKRVVEKASETRVRTFIQTRSVGPLMARIDVVREADLHAGDSTQGITRGRAFDAAGIAVSRTRVPGGVASGWHHHESRHLFGFVVAGRLLLEHGPGGSVVEDVGPGDFFHIAPRVVHRDVNPSADEDTIVVNILAGEGPTVVNVEGPEPS